MQAHALQTYLISSAWNHQVVTARTGFGGALGNKGGVAVRLQIYDRYR
jgi:hypothetical protein